MTIDVTEQIKTVANARAGRRSLMRNAGVGVAGVAALSGMTAAGVGGLALTSPSARAATTYTDADILNFALNLEYLEANYYLYAVTGQGVATGDQTGTGTQGKVTGGAAVPFKTPIYQQYAANIAADEQTHVRFLRAALGSSAVAMPNIDIVNSWNTLALAAGLIVKGQTFNPFADEISFLIGAYVFEDVGVTAYCGALAALTTPANVTYAGAIEAVEAYHAATVRTLLATIGGGGPLAKISALRATLAGTGGMTGIPADDQGVLMPNGAVNVGPFGSQALVFRRTPQQVLNIVYGATGTGLTSGLFFPSGMNGTIYTS
ncbi:MULTISPECIES: ferritin-like domain-containing protein [Acidiphilium]|jgi:hypothetical protein|uniref:Ferritin-like domain-containing protein n=1 Tax=Acidiphilium rubrum TaxID=526 RepID=A0A8G2FGT6_ACIRU|nr:MULTISPECIES: ferritin-like domain-containing protein [Acidiphilium]MBW4036450.1 ferritin-like domain-containing protein [Pseudomonadota bacterium]SIQ91103.1 Ferritin-like domain-containing protein [Acidiphilium rubrum]